MATLGSQAVGSIVKLNVNGTAWNWIVVHQGLPGSNYDASCDGTWLLMQDIYENQEFDSQDNDYENSDIHSYLSNTFVNLFDGDIKSVIEQVKLPYTKGTGQAGSLATGSNGLSATVFLLSYTEVGLSGGKANREGYVLSYFEGAEDSKRVAMFNGSRTMWNLRSPSTITSARGYAWCVETNGSADAYRVRDPHGVRPALVLPSELSVESDGSVTLASGAITGDVNIGGVQRELTGKGYINIGGVLRELTDSNVNIGGILESLKG